MRPVVLLDYDPAWPLLFAAERDRILAVLGELVESVDHIGSTSVPGLAAKPKIDIDAVMRAHGHVPDAVARFRTTGAYDFHGDPYGDGRWTFTSGSIRGVRLYLCGPANEAHRERILFRDWLRTHPQDAVAYEALKRRLAAAADGDFASYTDGKSAFVAEILRKAVEERPPGPTLPRAFP
ncbi:MAG: GrpB family protein [Hyphomicrobiales bacterium]|nr:GrpB family protein [Hyphomicrobiales bacterium]